MTLAKTSAAGPMCLATDTGDQPLLAHDPGNALAAGGLAVGRQGPVNARGSIPRTTVGEGLLDPLPQFLVTMPATAGLPTSPSVVTLPRHFEHLTLQRVVVLSLLRPDEREPHLLSLAKKAVVSSTSQGNTRWKTEAGERNASVFRGRSFRRRAIPFKSACENPSSGVPFGKYCLSRRLVFSFVPRCQGL